MKKIQIASIVLFISAMILSSCGSDDSEAYTELSPVVLDLTAVPYPKLSDYKFFTGDMKNLEPANRVIPYDLNSSLFTDYALKKRFVWMPHGTKATYTSDGEVLNFPTGSVLIKNFYYENMQPDNTTKIIETRLMIKKADGWIFATYVWNDEQTEAVLNMDGQTVRISWGDEEDPMTANYRIPSETDCATCHKLNEVYTPIGVKPQNLFKNYVYADGPKNQLAKWKETGYLNTVPANVLATVNWEDTMQPLDLRARSYVDVNCAHCHVPGNWKHATLNLAFSQTSNPVNMGVCVEPVDFVSGDQTYIVAGQDAAGSLMPYRMNTTVQSDMMPTLGRSLIHTEGVELIEDWINSLDTTCP
jgi:uncharacterized repeat protein (TIGR03806 family)